MAVGYITPPGETTPWGNVIDTSVSLTSTSDQRKALTARYGKQWEQGAQGKLHSSDHKAALEKLWLRGQAGMGTGGLLAADGKGFDGEPSLEEVYDSYYGVNSKVLDAAHQVLPGEYGYGRTPLSPAERQEGWTTGTWRVAIGPWGFGRNWPKSLKADILEQINAIEAGVISGWELKGYGGWGRIIV